MTNGKRKVGQRVSMDGYAKMLAMVVRGNGRADEIAEAVAMQYDRADRVLQWMQYFGIMHVCRWEIVQATRVRRAIPVYQFGPGEPAIKPIGRQHNKRPARIVRVEIMAFCDAVKELQDEAHHGRSLSEASGLNQQTCRRLMRNLKREGLLFIEQYVAREIGGLGYPMYRFGVDQKDVRKPAPKSESQQTRERRQRVALRRMTVCVLGESANELMKLAA